ncbi:fatty acid synthase-like [Diabrotica undecimpunctata]|uniref:fatty acid synthase-like n=1 Tax=Diabrotica undecimpunctata TaxID=50387 RepID=UPI003B63A204
MEAPFDVVISGMSGRFPECYNVKEFQDAIFQGLNLATEDDRRFSTELKGLPHWIAKVPELDKFDASFFDIHYKQANFTDPRQRILLETVYESVVDAGYNPSELYGSKTGVYVGLANFTNMNEMRSMESNGYGNLGMALYGAANRISHAFNFRGPSMALDAACASSMYALIACFEKIRSGEIEYAVVCGTHLLLSPDENRDYQQLRVLSSDQYSRVFSKLRNGFVRAEGVATLFLQRKTNCRRMYATVLGAKGNANGHSKGGFTYPHPQIQAELMTMTYKEYGVNQHDISFLEIHGTGTRAGDAIECESVSTLCKQTGRKTPLMVGSVKSNTGHCENTAAIVSVIKIITAFETGIIAGNLHAEPVDETLAGIKDGTLKVVTKHTEWPTGLGAVNSFGIGGSNGHAVLKRNDKVVKPIVNRKHRLVQVSGRTLEAVNHFLDGVVKNKDDEEFLGLLDEIHKMNMKRHFFRGYTVLGQQPVRNISKYTSERPLVFIYSGLGTQWAGMGRDLLEYPVFRSTFTRCARAVEPYGLDLMDLILKGSETSVKDIVFVFTAIAAIQISLTDFLYSLDIRPDFYAGHSSGEVGCAYANGDLTPEQAVLLAFARGHSVKNQQLEAGQMAAVGLGADVIEKILPADIFVACQNSKSSVTISGPKESTVKFVNKLKEQNIFAHLVDTAGYAFHSKYIWKSYEPLVDFIRKVIVDPKPRSDKWISSSVAPAQANEAWASLNCAEYHANNFRNKVLFEQIYEHIPENAIVLEIAPNGIFQAILKKQLGLERTVISLTKKAADDQEQFLLSAVGELFNAGAQPNLRKLYKETVFPVSRGTSLISPLVKWDHSITWFVPMYKHMDGFGKVVKVNISTEADSYLKGHNIDGRVMMPAFAYMEMVWKVFAELKLKEVNEFPVVFEDVKLIRATILPENENIEFLVNIMKQTGHFEIHEGGSIVVSGKVRSTDDVSKEFKPIEELYKGGKDLPMCKREDFYKDTRLRRMNYSGVFQGIVEWDIYGLNGTVEWMESLGGFLDSVYQISKCENLTKDLIIPTSVKKMVIDPVTHFAQVAANKFVEVQRDPYLHLVRTKGIEITDLKYEKATKREKTHPDATLEDYQFIPYDIPVGSNKYDLRTSLSAGLQIVCQNVKGLIKRVSVCQLKDDSKSAVADAEVNKLMESILDKQILTEIDYTTDSFSTADTAYDVVIVTGNVSVNNGADNLRKFLRPETGFVIYVGDISQIRTNFEILFKTPSVSLLRSKQEPAPHHEVINVSNTDFSWLEKLKKAAKDTESKTVYLVAEKEETSGVVGLLKCLLTEDSKVQFKAVFTNNAGSEFSLNNSLYKTQLSKQLNINVLKAGTWGTYIHIPLEDIPQKFVNHAVVSVKNLGVEPLFNWIEYPKLAPSNNKSSQVVNVNYSALNIIDSQIAAGDFRLKPVEPTDTDADIGFEYSGVTESKKKVMGIVARKGLSLQVNSDPHLTWEVPSSWNLEQAATVPVIYSLCYLGMVAKGQLQKEETVLLYVSDEFISAATSIARGFKCRIFLAVNTEEQRALYKNKLPDVEIGLAKDSAFLDLIHNKTGGKGLDLIVNTVDDVFLEKSITFLSNCGRVVTLIRGSFQNAKINTDTLHHTNFCVSLDILLNQNVATKENIRTLVKEGISSGHVQPLPSAVYKPTELSSAVKQLRDSNNKEKILINLAPTSDPSILALPKVYFDPSKSFIINGGLGGMGLELTDWLLSKGARNIVLNGRRNITNGYQAMCMRRWAQYQKVVIKVSTTDASTLEGAETLIKEAQELGPVGGIFNSAMVLQDANLADQTVEMFNTSLKPKTFVSENMDKVSRKLCPTLDFFVLFSSMTSGRGNLGQTNYGMANSSMEMLCEKRKRANLPGLAVQWGPIGEVGALSSLSDDQEFLYNIPQRVQSCFDALEKLILQGVAIGASTVVSDRKKLGESTASKTPVNMVAHIMGISDVDVIDKNTKLVQLGLDSLMITEIKQVLFRNFQLTVGLEEIRAYTFDELSKIEVKETPKTIQTELKKGEWVKIM